MAVSPKASPHRFRHKQCCWPPSVTSALVGLWVYHGIQHLLLHNNLCMPVTPRMIFFWIWGTFSAGISSPVAEVTMMLSASSMMASRFSMPSVFSILHLSCWKPPASIQHCLISLIQSAVRTKDAAIKSNPLLDAKTDVFFILVGQGRSFNLSHWAHIDVLFPFPSSPPLTTTLHTISVLLTSITSISIRPSIRDFVAWYHILPSLL